MNAGLSITQGVENIRLPLGDLEQVMHLQDADNNIAIGQEHLTSDTLGSKTVSSRVSRAFIK